MKRNKYRDIHIYDGPIKVIAKRFFQLANDVEKLKQIIKHRPDIYRCRLGPILDDLLYQGRNLLNELEELRDSSYTLHIDIVSASNDSMQDLVNRIDSIKVELNY